MLRNLFHWQIKEIKEILDGFKSCSLRKLHPSELIELVGEIVEPLTVIVARKGLEKKTLCPYLFLKRKKRLEKILIGFEYCAKSYRINSICAGLPLCLRNKVRRYYIISSLPGKRSEGFSELVM